MATKGNTLFFLFYSTGVMLLLLYSLHAYFLWWMYDNPKISFAADLIVALFGFIYMNVSKIPYKWDSNTMLPFVVIWIATAWNPLTSLFVVFKIPFTFLTLLMLDKESLRKLLRVWTNIYAVILLVSLIAWPLAFAGILPARGMIQFGEDVGYIFQNYGLCLINLNFNNFDVIRFCSIFLEPGHVSMIGAFTLYANRFDFKKWNTWVIFLVSLVTLSLAGYLLIVFGYLMLKVQKASVRQSVFALLGALVTIGIIYAVVITYKGGDNLVNTLIVERLNYDEDKGIEGNNRFYGHTDYIFEQLLESQDFFTGISPKRFMDDTDNGTMGGAGYKMYLIEKGLIGTLFALLGYWLITQKALDKKYIKYFLLLYILAFIQRAWPTQPIWLYLFVFATAVEPHATNRGFVKIKKKQSITDSQNDYKLSIEV